MNSIIHSTHPDMSKLPGGFEPKSINIDFDSTCLSKTRIKEVSDSTLILHNVFSKDDCNKLINLMMQSPNFESVSIQGRKDIPDARIGSIRTTVWSPELAEKFYKKMYYMFEPRFTNEFTATDWWQGNKERKAWLPNGVSPMLRMMRYEKSGQHYAHYDAAFIYPEDRFRTLMSFVVYLTTMTTVQLVLLMTSKVIFQFGIVITKIGFAKQEKMK